MKKRDVESVVCVMWFLPAPSLIDFDLEYLCRERHEANPVVTLLGRINPFSDNLKPFAGAEIRCPT